MALIRINQLPAGDANLDDHLPRENTSDVDAKITIQQIVDLAPQGDVVGPPVAIDNEVLVSDGITGKLLKQSGLIVNTATPVFYNSTIPYMGSDGSGLTVDPDGYFNFDDAKRSLSVGGSQNSSGTHSVALGGQTNNTTGSASGSLASENGIASGTHAVALGANTYNATGDYSLAQGLSSEATANHTKAMGRRAKAAHAGSTVLSDSQNADYSSSTTDQLSARFSGGFRLQGGPLQFNGASVVADGSLSNSEINWSVVGNNVQGKYKNSGGTVFSFTLPSGGSSSYVKLSSQTVVGLQSFVDFNNLSTSYTKYILEITEFSAGSLSAILAMQVSTDNGSTFVSSAGAYSYNGMFCSNVDGSQSNSFSGGGGSTFMAISQGLSTTSLGHSFAIEIYQAMNSSYVTEIISRGNQQTSANLEGIISSGGRRVSAEANNAIRLLMSSGQIAGGIFTLYGVLA